MKRVDDSQEDLSAGRATALAGSSLFILVATGFINLAMLVFHRVTSSALGVEYAQLATIIGLINVVSGLTSGLGVWLMRQVAAGAASAGPTAAIARLHALVPRLLAGLLGLALVLAAAGLWAIPYFHVRSPLLYALATAIVLLLYVEALIRSATQGLQRFGLLAWSLIAEGIGRAGLAWVLLGRGAGIAGALAGWLLGALMGLVVCVPGLMPSAVDSPPSPRPSRLTGHVALDTGCVVVFMAVCHMDLFAVQHYFAADQAARYARAALVAKAFLLAPVAVVTVLTPRVVTTRARNEDSRKLLLRALTATAFLLGAGHLAVWLFTPTIIRIMCGASPEFQALAPLVRLVCLAITPIATWQVVLYYQLAGAERWTLLLTACTAAGYALALWGFHQSFAQVISSEAVTGLGALSLGLIASLRRARPESNATQALGPPPFR